MSVLIYGVDDNSKEFDPLVVSSEERFYSLWQPVIQRLNLKFIGDQRWLYKTNLKDIIIEFQQVLQYVSNNDKYSLHEQELIRFNVEIIVNDLENRWNKVPESQQLWMG